MQSEKTPSHERLRERVRDLIEKKALIMREKRPTILSGGGVARWMFDFRPLVLAADSLDDICELFWENVKSESGIQVGGLETTSIAMTAGLILKGREKGTPLTGFYVRKSRDKDGLQNHIEGNLSDKRIVLVDDTLNSGQSLLRQVKLLETLGRRVDAVLVIVRFREIGTYKFFTKRGIKIISLFTLDDFPATGGIEKYAEQSPPAMLESSLAVEWKFNGGHPSYFHTVPKSTPTIDEKCLYFGSDNGSFFALDQRTGNVEWEWRLRQRIREPHIFSSPALSKGVLYFGAYDGNVYAIEAVSGKTKWIYREADWVGSSPCVSNVLSLVFIGLEFGLRGKSGGFVAIDANTGKERWSHRCEARVTSSPTYSERWNAVVFGTESGEVYCLDAATGAQKWLFKGSGAVRASFAIDDEREYVCFGSLDSNVYILDMRSGAVMKKIESFEPVWSTPYLHDDRIYLGLLDKRILCVDMESGDILWTHWANSRVFSSPVLIHNRLYCGSNDGRLYVLDPRDGRRLDTFQATERIMNKVVHNETTKQLFVTTYANEIYCLRIA